MTLSVGNSLLNWDILVSDRKASSPVGGKGCLTHLVAPGGAGGALRVKVRVSSISKTPTDIAFGHQNASQNYPSPVLLTAAVITQPHA